jgi:hypothetical protein
VYGCAGAIHVNGAPSDVINIQTAQLDADSADWKASAATKSAPRAIKRIVADIY